MTATLKTTVVQEPSSSTANLTLDTSGGVTIGAASTIAGVPIATTTDTQTLTNKTLTSPTINGMNSSIITSGTTKASTSGTTVEFTGIPSWAKRITVMFSGLSTSGTSILQMQLGTSGGYVTSGYLGSVNGAATGVAAQTITTGLAICRTGNAAAAALWNGKAEFCHMGSNLWAGNTVTARSDTAETSWAATSLPAGGTVDRVRFTTVNGTDTFDAGSINILYE